MSERTVVGERLGGQVRAARRGGGQVVGDFVGLPAGEAAQAVRRGGLRPGLDRSFGCSTELIGLVVAQDPPAGSEVARNGMVTLFVAAPGGWPDGEAARPADDPSDGEPDTGELSEEAPESTVVVPSRSRRRRKPGLARRSAAVSGHPSPVRPVTVGGAPRGDVSAMPSVGSQTGWVAEGGPRMRALEEGFAGERGEDGFPRDDLLVHLEDVLAGRRDLSGWRGACPRWRGMLRERGGGGGGGVRAWLGEHRLLAGAFAAAFVLWMVVAVSSMTGAPEVHSPHAGSLTTTGMSGVRPRGRMLRPVARSKTRGSASARRGRSASAPRRSVRRGRPRPELGSAPVVRGAAAASPSAPAAEEEPSPEPSQGAPVRQASSPSGEAPEQSGGGPFSP